MLSENEILKLIRNDVGNVYKRQAELGRKYYDGKHDILSYKIYYYNGDGVLVEDSTRSNIKICHPFFTELVDQCVQYMLSGRGSFIKSDNPELQAELDGYFGDEFRSQLADVLTDVCVGGFGAMFAYMSKSGKLVFEYADATGVTKVKAADTSDNEDYVIYTYFEKNEKSGKRVQHVQVWGKECTAYYVLNNDRLIPDENEPINPRGHVVYNNGEEYGLGFIPFFEIDSGRKKASQLAPIKSLIDDYDLMACGLSNNIQDVSEAIYVVKGFQGDNLDELIQNVKTKKHIGIEPDGDVDVKTIDIPYEARIKKLEIDEKNIYRFGMGFNASMVGDGNVTNIVIKSRYALLDMKCNKLENRLKQLLWKLIDVALGEINSGGTSYDRKDIYIDLTREIMTNSSDNADIETKNAQAQALKIGTLLDIAPRIGDENLLIEICNVLDLDYNEIIKKAPMGDVFDINKASEALLNDEGNEGEDE